jgi:signal transduction histidine kinase
MCDRRDVQLRTVVGNPRGAVIVARAGAFGLCVGLTVIRGTFSDRLSILGALLVIALTGSLVTSRRAMPWAPYFESFAAAAVVAYATPLDPVGLPYLLAPALEAGLLWGVTPVVTTVALAGVALTVGPIFASQEVHARTYGSLVAQWVVLALGTGAVAAWIRRVRLNADAPDAASASYAAAYRLLSQLRVVSRQLSGGLDAYSLGQAMLETLRGAVPYTRAAVYVRSEGGRLVPLAFSGVSRVDWIPSLDDDSAWAEAWTSGLPRRQSGMFSDGPGGYAAVLPLRVGMRIVGLVGIERVDAAFQQEQLTMAAELVDEAALRIETALLFSDVRQIATAEERRRLAREIHDGIAQELASLGYLMDDMAYRATDDQQRESLQYLRSELTRMISELRLSIFDLRSEVLATTGLGAALSDHVRTVGATSDLTVHLELDESPQRLRTEAEAELLRIAQEAVTNVRKHAGAQNLWVTVRTAPPSALLRIEDDGLGLGAGRADSYGMDIMRERADRLGAALTVSPRDGGGTVVEVALGTLGSGAPRGKKAEQAGNSGKSGKSEPNEGGARVHDGAAR